MLKELQSQISKLFVVALLLVSCVGFSQAASATWAGTSNLNASISGSNITAAAVTVSGATSINSSSNGVTSSNWPSSGMSTNYYYQYQVTPSAGSSFKFTGVSFAHSVNSTTFADWGASVSYSTNGFADSDQIGNSFSPSTSQSTFSQNGLSVTVNPGETLTVRVYAWGGPFFGSRVFRIKNMVISGTACNGVASFTSHPSGGAFCTGGALSISATAANATSYQWKKDNVNIQGATSATFSKSGITSADAGTYTLVATSSCGSVTSNAAVITVNPAPTSIAANASAATVCPGTSVNLSVSGNSNSASGTITVLSENFNDNTNSFTKINNTTGGNNASAAWTLRPEGYQYATSSTVTFSSNDNSQFYLTNSDAPGQGSQTSTILQTPAFSTVGLTSANVSFYHYFRRYNSGETAKVQISTDGNSWSSLADYTASQGQSGSFASVTLSLAGYLNQPTVYVRFKYDADYGYYWAIDNVSVTGNGTLPTTYAWTSSPAGFTSSLQNPTVSPTQNTTYTVTVTNSYGCSASASTAVAITPAAAGGTVAGAQTICINSQPANLVLSGHVGNVVKWQRSANASFSPATDISSTSTTLTGAVIGNLASNTYFRAVVQSGSCSTANSAAVLVAVNAASAGGTVAGSTTVCASANSGSLTLSAHVGNVVRWESSLDNFATAATTISNTGTTLNFSNIAQTTYYRAVVQNGNCAVAMSSVATVSVYPVAVGGTISGSTTVCSTVNSGSLTLAGNVGNVIGWESSTNNFLTAGTPIANTTNTLNYSNLGQTTYYRAIVQSGNCASATSSIAAVFVAPSVSVGILSGNATYCSQANSGTITLAGFAATVFGWEYSFDNFATAGIPVSNNSASLNYTNVPVTTYYRVLVGNGVCAGVYSNVVAVVIDTNSAWTGAVDTDWHNAANWSCAEVPQPYTVVSIPAVANQPVISANASAYSIAMDAGATLRLTSGNDLTVTDAIHSDGTLTIENNANLIQVNDVANSGVSKVKRNSSALMRQDYTIWSSPVSGQQLLAFSPQTLTNRFYTYNTATNLFNTISSPANTSFAAGTGYLIRMPNNHPTTPTVWNGEFTGVLQNGNISVPLNNVAAGQRFNAIGNPYPSAIDIETFVADNAQNITGAIYFWRKTNNPVSPSYCSWTKGGGFVTNNEAQAFNPQDAIRTGQGFIVEASAAGTQVVFNNAQRLGDNNNQFFRSANQIERNRVWLNASSASGAFSQTLVGYITGSTLGEDAGIDGKFFNDGEISFYSLVGDERFVIQGRPLPFDQSDIVPMGFKATNAGSYSISIDHKDGLFEAGQDIFLKDNATGTIHDLNSGAYTFASEAGIFNSRFEVIYQNSLGNEVPDFAGDSVIVYKQNGQFTINSGNATMESVKVYDVLGKLLKQADEVNASEISFTVPGANQVLIFKIKSADGKEVAKKVVN